MKSAQPVVCFRSGAVGTPWRLRILPTVWSEISWPRLARAPTIRSYPPARILRSHPYNQPLEFRISPQPARSPARLRTIELAGNELAVPAQDGVGQRGVRDLRQGLPTQPMTNFAQSCSFCVRQPQTTLQLGSENPVLS